MEIQDGTADALNDAAQMAEHLPLFLDMIRAGWKIPDWLKQMEWENLKLVTLHIRSVKKLPVCSPDTPVTLHYRPDSILHLLEKSLTLHLGQKKSFSFVDERGEQIFCYLNNISFLDIWNISEKKFLDPNIIKHYSPKELESIKTSYYQTLEQDCPKGMHYISIEYECTKDIQLNFYDKAYLKSSPKKHTPSTGSIGILVHPDQKTGDHHLPLKTAVIKTPYSPDTSAVFAEVFSYYEPVAPYEETIY